ncbi:MAG: efflux transporter outer membrane subunit [Opitutales bacterium]
MQPHRFFVVSIALLYVAGCASVPKRADTPLDTVPNQWATPQANKQPVDANWLKHFNDPDLEAIVAEAMANNPNLLATAARLDQARAEARLAGADRLPGVALGLGGARQRNSNLGPQPSSGSYSNRTNLDLNLSWELDLWGRLRNQSAAALAQAEASAADLAAARLSLAAQTAKAWFTYSEAAAQVVLAETEAENYATNQATLESRYRSGLSNSLELRQIRTEAANAQAVLHTRQRARDQAARRLEVLLGRYPSATLTAPTDLPTLPAAVPAGLPSDLLLRRPDLIAAERRLAASSQQVRAARKEWLPKLSLTGATGTSAPEFAELLNNNFRVSTVAGNLLQPIFQGGRIRANVDRRASQQAQAAAAYHNAALQAFLEVESTLAAETLLRAESQQLQRAADEASAAATLAWQQYRSGTLDFLNVLRSERVAANARSRYLSLRQQLLSNRIDLHLALGGSFRNP